MYWPFSVLLLRQSYSTPHTGRLLHSVLLFLNLVPHQTKACVAANLVQSECCDHIVSNSRCTSVLMGFRSVDRHDKIPGCTFDGDKIDIIVPVRVWFSVRIPLVEKVGDVVYAGDVDELVLLTEHSCVEPARTRPRMTIHTLTIIVKKIIYKDGYWQACQCVEVPR